MAASLPCPLDDDRSPEAELRLQGYFEASRTVAALLGVFVVAEARD